MKEIFVLFFTFRWRELFLEPSESGWIQFFRYFFVGGLSYVLDFLVFLALQSFGMNYLVAELFSFCVGFLLNFYGGRALVFHNGDGEKASAKELFGVLTVALLGLLWTELLLYAGVEWLHLHKLIAKAIAGILVMFWNYFARKYFVYKK